MDPQGLQTPLAVCQTLTSLIVNVFISEAKPKLVSF
jgi:hypothetical protein